VKEEVEDSDVKLKDKIDFKITTGTRGIGVKVQYEQEVKTGDMKNETETEYEIVYDRIIEFRNTAGDDEAYDWDDNNIVQTLLLSDWELFSEITDSSDGVQSQFAVSSLDGHVTFNFTVSRADQEDKDVTANKMTIDFSLVDFPWMYNDTYVALLSTVESKKKVDIEYDNDEMVDGPAKKAKDVIISFDQAQDASGIIPFGEYTWQETAEAIEPAASNETGTAIQRSAGGVVVPATIRVVATSAPTPTNNSEDNSEDNSETMPAQRIAFSFVGDAAISASNIYWDPEAGIGYSESASAAGASSDAGPINSSFLALCGALTCWMYLSAL
jgi:hypothetical protein